MIRIVVDSSETTALQRFNARDIVAPVAFAVAEATRNVIAPYPPQRRAKQPFVSAKQRRAFFAMLRKGVISVPYRREGLIGRSWRVTPRSDGAELSNNARGVAYVHAAKTQAAYHRGHWTTDEEAAQRVEALGIAQRAAEVVLTRLLKESS